MDLSSTKGDVFINLGKKILRGVGYFFCAILLILCILLVISAAAFGSKNTVSIFGFNIYMVQTDSITTAPKDSALFVQKCSAYDLNENKLILYTKASDNTEALGYVKNIYVSDGSFYITVSDNGKDFDLPETALIGRADYTSKILGSVINFIKTPFGIFCMAFLPCIALILYDIIRASAAGLPPPEVVPLVKNAEDDQPVNAAGIAVNADGKASYSRNSAGKSPGAADNVLFTYSAKQKKREERPIIPLTDKKPAAKSEPPAETKPIRTEPPRTSPPRTNPGALRPEQPKAPVSTVIGRYTREAERISGKTAELPNIPKKDESDAFFVQSKAPQITPQINRILPEHEKEADSEKTEEQVLSGRTGKTAGRRSTQILASKRMEDLISDDDDSRDKIRYEVDDILSGMERKK